MTTTENLLVTLMEECAEIQQAAAKALRFGLESRYPEDGGAGNCENIITEYFQLQAVYGLLQVVGAIPRIDAAVSREIINSKIDKVKKFMHLSHDLGTLQDG